MSGLKNVLPAHLKSSLGGSGGEAEFAKKHHGKTQSHMVSFQISFYRLADGTAGSRRFIAKGHTTKGTRLDSICHTVEDILVDNKHIVSHHLGH